MRFEAISWTRKAPRAGTLAPTPVRITTAKCPRLSSIGGRVTLHRPTAPIPRPIRESGELTARVLRILSTYQNIRRIILVVRLLTSLAATKGQLLGTTTAFIICLRSCIRQILSARQYPPAVLTTSTYAGATRTTAAKF